MTEPWIEAAKADVKHQARKTPDWDDFCAGVGWGRFGQESDWAKSQFKAALKVMPKDHPDRWKYQVGAKYARWDKPGWGTSFPRFVFTFLTAFLAAFSVFAGIAALVSGYPVSILLLGFSLTVAGYWVHWWVLRTIWFRRGMEPEQPSLGRYM